MAEAFYKDSFHMRRIGGWLELKFETSTSVVHFLMIRTSEKEFALSDSISIVN
jgi:hypothetical protein